MEALRRVQEETTAAAFSSSPAFGTPVHPFPVNDGQRPLPPPAFKPAIATILPILLPPATLRPLAFRTFTKKHNLTLTSSALQALASFIGRHCGSGWREEGLGEKVLEEVARMWKAADGAAIVEDGEKLKTFLHTLEGCMSAGRVLPAKSGVSGLRSGDASRQPPSLERQGSSFGLSELRVDSPAPVEEENLEDCNKDPRSWLKVVSAFEQPRLTFNVDKKHFLTIEKPATPFPSPSHKTALFRERYNIIHQRVQRNPAFQAPALGTGGVAPLRRSGTMTEQQFFKLTPISNLLGRGGSTHLLLGMLAVAPTGTLAINDLSGSISLSLQHATSMQVDAEPFFCPGMIVLVDGVYEEDWAGAGSSGLGNTQGVGGTIGGRFVAFQIGVPPVEQRNISLGVNVSAGDVGGAFGWTDFLGQGSERSLGARMRKIENRVVGPDSGLGISKRRMVMLAGVTLDLPSTLAALRKIFEQYSAAENLPSSFVLMGDFSSKAAMAGAGTGSIEYKELFNDLAAVLADFPSLLRSCTWVFVPGDNDPWASSFSAGAGTLIPREGIPELFTSRIKRAFATAKSEGGPTTKKDEIDGEAIWTSNPTRLTLFGPAHEIIVFRDNLSSRFRRNAVRIGQSVNADPAASNPGDELARGPDEDVEMSGALSETGNELLHASIERDDEDRAAPSRLAAAINTATAAEMLATQAAKRLILSVLPQSTLSPFPLATRSVHWDYGPSALSLYPLPHTLILADTEMPQFALTYEGCHVVNPGRLVEGAGSGPGRKRAKAQWIEYDIYSKRGIGRELWVG
jgi:DNA polymerase epsilon subunit 2